MTMIKTITKESTTAKSYAQVTAATPVTTKAQKQTQIRQQRAKVLQERAKYEVSLTAASLISTGVHSKQVNYNDP
jgi:hypothetical protein